ncbi:non-hydrolyzing UDP-N-acetylglucosamine 2-epimerase [Limosilactobacillus pontis]|uniref:non-hydrolyzing UDP-N-acetylglucosamine 2-epimerase n=1 Tax=Limosilactobacillus pontis TaxID=35787 RepID=UPI00241F094B|nr:UDP-N-acetylglucosamine 2-epimerase (non-hydrolyzing) [Limosilactobacillus pontis]
MRGPYQIMSLFGTRAEALKLAPVIERMQAAPDTWQPIVVTTAQEQHQPQLRQVLDRLKITPDFNLDVAGGPEYDLVEQLSKLLHNLNNVMHASQPDMILVAGDATTSLAASLVCFYQHLPLGHVEAGLRTYDKELPFPDEMHRRLTDDLADLYFAPTTRARDNLLKEFHPAEQVYVTGNTSIDAVEEALSPDFHSDLLDGLPDSYRLIILTMSRAENVGEPMRQVFHTVRDIVETNPDVELVCPLTPDPEVMSLAGEVLGDRDRIHLTKPLPHKDFLNIAARSTLIITDSGTIQEEAPALHKPVLLLREKTERQEAVDVGAVQIVGTDPTSIQQAVFELLNNERAYQKMATAPNPFGDGHASAHILGIIEDYLKAK